MFSKKTAVAAATLLAAFAAQAQVSVYGNVDLFLGRIDMPGVADSTTNIEAGIATGSFIGFKGQEDLGGNLKAFFKLESALAGDTGGANTSNFWARTSELGLSGDFGTVKAGNSLSLGFLANNTFNPFSATGIMSTSQFLNGHGVLVNSITYNSPNLSGFSAAVQVGLSERTKAQGQDKNAYGVQANYTAGPLALGATFSSEYFNPLAIGAFAALDAADVADVQDLIDQIGGVKSDRWQLGASYDFGVAKLLGQYGQNKLKFTADSVNTKFFQIGLVVPVSAQGAVVASYAEHKIEDAKLKDLSLAYDHTLSKRTGMYVGLKNVRTNFLDPKSGTTFGVGMRHSF